MVREKEGDKRKEERKEGRREGGREGRRERERERTTERKDIAGEQGGLKRGGRFRWQLLCLKLSKKG